MTASEEQDTRHMASTEQMLNQGSSSDDIKHQPRRDVSQQEQQHHEMTIVMDNASAAADERDDIDVTLVQKFVQAAQNLSARQWLLIAVAELLLLAHVVTNIIVVMVSNANGEFCDRSRGDIYLGANAVIAVLLLVPTAYTLILPPRKPPMGQFHTRHSFRRASRARSAPTEEQVVPTRCASVIRVLLVMSLLVQLMGLWFVIVNFQECAQRAPKLLFTSLVEVIIGLVVSIKAFCNRRLYNYI